MQKKSSLQLTFQTLTRSLSSLKDFKTWAVSQLSASPSAALDTDVLVQHITGLSKTQLLLKRDEELSPGLEAWLKDAVAKRQTGLPVAYITGHKEFYGYDFYVSPAVLIPKPDTEVLVEKAIDIIIEKMEARPNSLLYVCDMCTGSGCIGLSVLRTLIDVYKIPVGKLPIFNLVDISGAALEVAQKNADELIPENARSLVRFIQSNLFEMVPGKFDVILTNPPYIPASMVDELLQDGRCEPRLALDGDVTHMGEKSSSTDGLDLIRRLIPEAQEHLNPLGSMIMETGEYNAEEAAALAEDSGFKPELYRDLEGQLRGFVCR